jgi:hypothetical protein
MPVRAFGIVMRASSGCGGEPVDLPLRSAPGINGPGKREEEMRAV